MTMEINTSNTISLEETVHTTKYDSYQCDICQKKFKSQQNLKRHLKIHDGTKLFCPSGCIFTIVIIYFVCFYVLVHVLTLVEGFAAKCT
jgi:hypothetical protein